MEPMNEIKIGQQEHVSLRSIVKSLDEIDGEPSTFWYAQVRSTLLLFKDYDELRLSLWMFLFVKTFTLCDLGSFGAA